MPAERLSMRKVREVLRLKYACGASDRVISRSVGIGRTAIGVSGLEAIRHYAGAVDPAGHVELASFELEDGVPRWRWAIGHVLVAERHRGRGILTSKIDARAKGHLWRVGSRCVRQACQTAPPVRERHDEPAGTERPLIERE